MSEVRIYTEDRRVDVVYGWPVRVPVEGEILAATGQDPELPEGVWVVRQVGWLMDASGPRTALVMVETEDERYKRLLAEVRQR